MAFFVAINTGVDSFRTMHKGSKNVGFIGALSIVVIAAAVFVCVLNISVNRSIVDTAPKSKGISVAAHVTVFESDIEVKNNETFDWHGTEICLNDPVVGYRVKLPGLKAGATERIELREFVNRHGERFNPDRVPTKVSVQPDGYSPKVFVVN